MSSPSLKHSDFSLIVDPVVNSAVESRVSADSEANPLLTIRAMMAVTLLGAGFWYVLWKIALHLWLSR